MAVNMTHREFSLTQPVKMIHLNDVFQLDLNIWSSSPGLPWKELGYKTKREIRDDPDAVRRVRWFWHRIKQGEVIHAPDSCAFVRSHLVPIGENKVRAVWGYPATLTFGEAMFAVPLIDAYKNVFKPYLAYGFETGTGGFRKLWRRFAKHDKFYCLDFKSFDKTVPAWLINHAFDILEYNIDFVHYQDYGTADARKNHRMWQYIRNYFINTPIRLCNGERYRKSQGVASGSYFTQLIDSIVNSIITNYWCLRLTGSAPADYLVLGDDSIVASNCDVDLDDIDDLVQTLGMKINLKKSMKSRSLAKCTFLGYSIGPDGIPFKDRDDLMASIYYPERPDKSWDDVASRALGILYANLGWHNDVHQFCDAIVRFKPFDLHLTRPQIKYMRFVLGLSEENIGKLPPPSQFDFTIKLHQG